jgi:drug/metabolite transporter (DMT)-like permease
VIYGLITALGWGTSAIAATKAARRAGTYLAVLGGQGVGVVVLVLLAAFLPPPLGAIRGPTAIGLAGAGLLGLVGYLTFYRALEYGGAVGLVSAISATYGGITTVLAVIVLGERLGGIGTVAVVLAVAGVAMASARSQGITEEPTAAIAGPGAGPSPAPAMARGRGLSRAGVPLALASAVAYGIGGFLLGQPGSHRRGIERQLFGEFVHIRCAPGAGERAVDGQPQILHAHPGILPDPSMQAGIACSTQARREGRCGSCEAGPGRPTTGPAGRRRGR